MDLLGQTDPEDQEKTRRAGMCYILNNWHSPLIMIMIVATVIRTRRGTTRYKMHKSVGRRFITIALHWGHRPETISGSSLQEMKKTQLYSHMLRVEILRPCVLLGFQLFLSIRLNHGLCLSKNYHKTQYRARMVTITIMMTKIQRRLGQ